MPSYHAPSTLKLGGVLLHFPSLQKESSRGNLKKIYAALDIPLLKEIPVSSEEHLSSTLLKDLHTLTQEQNLEGLVIGCHDSPFYVLDENKKLIESFIEYGADLTFGEGYPAGSTVWVLRSETLPVMENIRAANKIPLSRDIFAKIIDIDVNTFDIDNIYPEIDLRPLRLSFFADTHQNLDISTRLQNLPSMTALRKSTDALYPFNDLAEILQKNKDLFRSLPKYYEFTLTNRGQLENTLFPQSTQDSPTSASTSTSVSSKSAPSAKLIEKPVDLTLDDYKCMLEKAITFSHDPIIGISGCGEPTLHPQWLDFVETTLAAGVECVLETSGEGISEEQANILLKHPKRKQLRIIFKLHGANEETEIRVTGSSRHFAQRLERIEYMLLRNPQNTYVEAVKVRENVEHLGDFYRYFKRYTPNVLLSKYNPYRGALQERRDDPMKPFHPIDCWHLKRDVYVDEVGDAWVCKQDFEKTHSLGNLIRENMDKIFEAGGKAYLAHLKQWSFCANCDEGYTYNF